jgi:ABC-type transporter Mla subunit MlaD
MRERLEQLKKELQRGEQELARLDHQRQQLRDTMLRIAGAIQVVEELLAQNAAPEQLEELAPAT